MPVEQVAEDDYQSFCEALSSTARGRAFLEEFARRNRQTDTRVVLAALDRLEDAARAKSAASPEADRIRQDLRALLDTLRSARPQTENSPTAIKAATLAALIDFAQARIEALVLPAAPRDGDTLAAVPAEEQPELPIPHPAAAAPLVALVQAPVAIEAPPAANDIQPYASLQGYTVQAYVPSPAKRKTATIIPIVEFDYRAHQNGRTVPTRTTPEESWTNLAPPPIAIPAMMPPMPEVEGAEAPAAALTVEVKVEFKKEVEPYELWLDPPAVATAAPQMAETTAVETTAPAVMSPNEMTFERAEAVSPTAAMTGMAMTDMAMTDMAVPDAVADAGASPSTATAIGTIETLMQQMEQMEQVAVAAPAVKGHVNGLAEAPDPLAPLMALSEEERIALFT